MKRRQEIARLRSERDAAMLRAATAERALRAEREAHKAELDAAGLRAARAEAKAISMPGMCPDRATCLAACSAADHWRHHLEETS